MAIAFCALGSSALAHKQGYDLYATSSWVFNCTVELRYSFFAEGYSVMAGHYWAHKTCACVIERLVEEFTLAEMAIFTEEQREEYMESHARFCREQLSEEFNAN